MEADRLLEAAVLREKRRKKKTTILRPLKGIRLLEPAAVLPRPTFATPYQTSGESRAYLAIALAAEIAEECFVAWQKDLELEELGELAESVVTALQL